MKNYQQILRDILKHHLSDSEKNFLMYSLEEELKRIRRNDIILNGETTPRKLSFVNRDFYDLSTENLRALDVIKDPFALTPLQGLNYLINHISDDSETVLAIRFLTKCFNSKTGEADLIVEKVDNKIFKTNSNISFTAPVLSLMIEINYGSQLSKGLKNFKSYDKFIGDLRKIFRKFSRNPIQDVHIINKKLLGIVNTEIRRNSTKQNQEDKALLEELKIEIENTLN